MKTLKLSSNFNFNVCLKKHFPFFFFNKPTVANFGDRLKDKEAAEEKFFFDKEERRLAQNLLRKLKVDRKAEPHDDESYKQKERLKRILDTHHEVFSDGLLDEILRWKRIH